MPVTLILMRHALAAAKTHGQRDRDRPLTEQGRADADAAARFLRQQGYRPDLTLCSPAQRTRETWNRIQQVLALSITTRFDEALYLAAMGSWRDQVRHLPAAIRCALFVGHNSGIGHLAQELVRRDQGLKPPPMGDGFMPAALVVIAGADWRDLARHGGSLAAFWMPGMEPVA